MLKKIQLYDGYEIHVEFENGIFNVQGFLDENPVTPIFPKNAFEALVDRLNKSVGNFEESSAKALEEIEIDKYSNEKEVYEAIYSKLSVKEPFYQDNVSIV